MSYNFITEAKEILKNLLKSLFEFLETPSVMLEGIETKARLNLEINQNF